MPRLRIVVVFVALLPVVVPVVEASEVFERLHSFAREPAAPGGRLLLGDDGAFYGTTAVGSPLGVGIIFRLRTPQGEDASLEVLHVFDESDGSRPAGGLVRGPDGQFYGTTCQGGEFGGGVAYKIDVTGTFTLLHHFGDGDGRCPVAELTLASDNSFYGTTLYPLSDGGTVFKLDAAGAVTTLHWFQGPDGKFPYGSLVEANDGHLYGTTYEGGANDVGTVFRVTTTGELTTLHSFDLGEGGLRPFGGLSKASSGELYGTTTGGAGAFNATAFKIATDGAFTIVHELNSPCYSGLTEADGYFYCVSRTAIYRLSPTGDLDVIHAIDADADGRNAYAKLTLGKDGALYDVMALDGPAGGGVAFRVTLAGEYRNLYDFSVRQPLMPLAELVQGPDGNFYGTSRRFGYGTVFRLDRLGAVTTLHFFDASEGFVYGGLVASPDGRFYGSTSRIVFSITEEGGLSVLHNFDDRSWSFGALLVGEDGALYGTRYEGGGGYRCPLYTAPTFRGCGLLYRITTEGDFTTLYDFIDPADGCYPIGSLIQGRDGNFYGSTGGCGELGYGTIFRVTPSGGLATLHAFANNDGALPTGRLLQARDGNFYGTTYRGGSQPCCNRSFGTVFRMTANGDVTTLHDFDYGDGSAPFAGLIETDDGVFYGTTSLTAGRGATGGTVFRIDRSGDFETLHAFAGPDGSRPWAPLVLGSDGALYGTTREGGLSDQGTVFRLWPSLAVGEGGEAGSAQQ